MKKIYLKFLLLGLMAFMAQAVEYSVVINADIDTVWNYNGNNENAKRWSTYFSSIDPCPVEECTANKFLDSSDIGFVRRPKRTSKKGKVRFWDERTLVVDKSGRTFHKSMMGFNFKNSFTLFGAEKYARVLIEQVYEQVDGGKTKLTFKSKLYKRKDMPGISKFQYGVLKTFFNLSSRRVKEIFRKNLINIKAHIEMGDQYKRIYPYK